MKLEAKTNQQTKMEPHTLGTIISELRGKIVFQREEAKKPGDYSKAPEGLPTSLSLLTKFQYPQGLYAHQAACIDSVLHGHHTVICTATASGKSICFSYPVMAKILTDKEARALFVFPVKALANDQIVRLKSLAKNLRLDPDMIKKFDGDVKGEARKEAITNVRILICTPDVLHTTLLRENEKSDYSRFFSNLNYVILDECHVYTGSFGSNMAYVLRRLRQITNKHKSNPKYIMSSATVGNPHEHLTQLTGLQDIMVIGDNSNGSPSYGKRYYMVEPEGPTESFALKLIRQLLAKETKFLVFCHTRQAVEHLSSELQTRYPEGAEYVRPYRAGFEADDRLGIEKAFRAGKLRGVISTSALELGVDLPNLDVCIMIGLPSTKVSLLQRAGRVGRTAKGSVVLLKSYSAFDYYYFNHPEELFEKPLEPLMLHLSNKQLMTSHYACARVESGDFDNPELDVEVFGPEFIQLAHKIREFDFPDDILYSQNPHFDMQIRSINDPSYNIVVGFNLGDVPIGSITYSQILREAYPGAVYLHMAKRYRVIKISYSKRVVLVDTRCPYAHTRPRAEVFVNERYRSNSGIHKKLGECLQLKQTSLGITEKVSGYVETSGQKSEVIDYDQPLMRHFVTDGVVFTLKGLSRLSYSAIVGLATALENAYPMCYPCAREDIASYAWVKGNEEARIFLYDTSAGGLALTWPAVDNFERLLELTLASVAGCTSCNDHPEQNGCIHCVAANRWYTFTVNSDRTAVIELIREIQGVLGSVSPMESAAQTTVAAKSSPGEGAGTGCGRSMLSEGSLVFTGKCQEGVVISSRPFVSSVNEDRLYEVSVNGKTMQLLGSSLSLLQGNIEKWCTSCGQEGLEQIEDLCPICGAQL